MSDVGAGQEVLASGLMTTAHEIGAALGVAVFSVVAAAQAAAGGGFAASYRHGFTVATRCAS